MQTELHDSSYMKYQNNQIHKIKDCSGGYHGLGEGEMANSYPKDKVSVKRDE